MRLEGSRDFAAPVERVWDVIIDPRKTAKLLPGVEQFAIETDTRWSARVRVPLSMGMLKLRFSFEKYDEEPLRFARLRAKGRGVSAMVAMDTSFRLTPHDDSRTTMDWVADVSVAGPVGAMGQRVLEPILRARVDEVMAALDTQVTAVGQTPEVEPAPAPTEHVVAEQAAPAADDATATPGAWTPPWQT